MEIDLNTLDLAVDKNIRPCLIIDDQLNKGEAYQHHKVIPTVRSLLEKHNLETSCFDNLKKAISSSVNLLNQNEAMQALNFIELVNEKELAKQILKLLYGPQDLVNRLSDFQNWATNLKTSKGHPACINLTVASYLLAMSNPKEHAFCKPSVYKSAVKALLHRDPEGNLPTRPVTTAIFYRKALQLFQERYQLPFTDLQHVHIAFYIMHSPYQGYPSWDELDDSDPTPRVTKMQHELNTILYGPPGTGKTYDTISRAVEICDGTIPTDRSNLVNRFEKLRKENRIQFVTFHQAYSYEDFIEGLRPVLNDGDSAASDGQSGDVRYECRPGIFKQLCEWASISPSSSLTTKEIDFANISIWKMSLGNTQDPDDAIIYDECIANNLIRQGYGGDVNFSKCDNRDQIFAKLQKEYPDTSKSDFAITAVDGLKNSMKVGDLVVVSDGNHRFRAVARITGPYKFIDAEFYQQARPVEWLLTLDESLPRETIYNKIFSQMTVYRLRKSELKADALRELLNPAPSQKRNYVIVIDEINRGNISKILGELITLLEPDKRIGAQNELRVTLPYSGKSFGVPGNVYVIGTMNTADRSIAFLDVALRRRFKFEEMMPNYELVANHWVTSSASNEIDLAKILRLLNARIELLYDRDHQIGHSFFLQSKSTLDVRDVFCHKVIPLLQEYFYGDWSKICTVLGCPTATESGSLQRNEFPIVQATSLSKLALLENADEIDDKLSFSIHPKFSRSTESAALLPYFQGIF